MSASLVARLAGQHVLVIGDVCLDEYLIGTPTRLSREAAIPVLEFQRRELIIGAAANPARNITALGSQASLVAAIGADPEGAQLLELLRLAAIDPAGVLQLAGRSTTIKTRVLANLGLRLPQQVARLDRVERRSLSASAEQQLAERIERLAPAADALLCSDYQAGSLTPAIIDAARSTARRYGRLLSVDAQGNADLYRGVDLFRCNAAEAEATLGRSLESEAEFRAGVLELQQRLEARMVIVTRGAGGLALLDQNGNYTRLAASNPSEVFDTTGAGDTFIAVTTLALSAGLSVLEAAHLANTAAGLVVRRFGNAVVTPAELAAALSSATPKSSGGGQA